MVLPADEQSIAATVLRVYGRSLSDKPDGSKFTYTVGWLGQEYRRSVARLDLARGSLVRVSVMRTIVDRIYETYMTNVLYKVMK